MYELNPNLRNFWRTKARNKILYGGRSSGKCLGIGTKVMMSNGLLKNVEDIIVGDKVMGPDSKPRNVLSTTRGFSKLYEVVQSSAENYIVNEDHILSVKRTKSSYVGKKLADGTISPRYPHLGHVVNMNVVDYMCESDKFKTCLIGYKAGVIDLPEQPLPLEPYFIGAWLGDGSKDCARITNMDPEVEEYLVYFANKMRMKLVKKGHHTSKASLYSIVEHDRFCEGVQGSMTNRVMEIMHNMGIMSYQKKKDCTNEKRIPEIYLLNSVENRYQLLAGLMDTDGTYMKDRGSMVITTVLENMAKDIKLLVDSLGFKSSLTLQNTSCQNGYIGTTWAITFSGNLDLVPCKIERKKAVPNKGVKDPLLTYIDVYPIGEGEYAGFALDGDHLFCLADGTVTHNSHDAAGFAIYLAKNYTIKFLCARRFQNRIAESVLSLLEEKINAGGFSDEFKITNNSIRHLVTGSEFIFYGIEKSLNEIKSLNGVHILWLEEANFITKEQFEVINPTIRAEDSEIWAVFNPGEITDFMWQNFVVKTPADTIKMHINYDSNPFMSATMIQVIENDKARMSEEEFAHIYLGEPRSGNDKAVIQYKYVEACIDAHLKLGWEPSGRRVVGFDVADDGNDTCATVTCYGNLVCDLDEWKGLEDEILKSSTRVWGYARQEDAQIIFDTIGVGAHCGSKFSELNEANGVDIIYEGFNAGSSVPDGDGVYMELPHTVILNKDFAENAKAYWWNQVSTRMRKTYEAVVLGVKHDTSELISISSSIPQLNQLKVELSTPMKDVSMSGKFKVESKKDLIKRGIKSPNLADAFIMSLITPEQDATGFFGF